MNPAQHRSAANRPEMPRRVSLRRLQQGQHTDLVGDLVLADDERVVVLPAGRGPVSVPRSEIRAMREVPARVVRPTSRVDDLVRLADLTWPGTQVVRLGGWSLHLGDGYSRRANSCHPTGTPERDLALAVEQVAGFYTERGLTPRFQLAARSLSDPSPGSPDRDVQALDALLAERGWQQAMASRVMVTDLDGAPDLAVGQGIELSEDPDEQWLTLGGDASPARIAVLRSAPAQYAALYVDGELVAVGRFALVADWGSLSRLHVSQQHRGRGHGRALTIAMMARARELGARYAHLQVAEDNAAAVSLYRSLGFVEHHRYHFRELRR